MRDVGSIKSFPLHSGVVPKRVVPSDQELDPLVCQQLQNALAEFVHGTRWFHIVFIRAHVLSPAIVSGGEIYSMSESRKVRVAALADCHYTKSSAGLLKDVFVRASETADVLVLCGDMTDYGLPEEAAVLAQDLKTFLRIPCVAVVGNHDFESGKNRRARAP